MKKNSAAVMSAAISLIVMLLASSQATLTFAADMNEPVMANSPVAPRTDTMIKSVVNGVTTPPDKIQLATWDNTLLESNAREIENDMARRTELEEASSASGGVEATNGQEGTYVRGASKPPMAYGVPLEIGPNGVGSKDNGTHYQLFDGAHIWKMVIDAPQATSLTLHFSMFYIPQCTDGACDLFIYSNEGTTLYYTHDDIRPDRKFVTPPIHGDRVTIEYYERFSHDPPMRLHITSVMQGFRDVSVRSASSTTGEMSTSMSMVPRLQDVYNITDDQDGVIAKGPHGDSGLCNNDITCQLGDSFDKERRAVVQILTGGTSGQAVCTGTLLNTQDSTKQYVITAHHCLGDSGGQSVDYWGFLFNYERECSRFAAPRRFDEFVQGARLLFADRPSDTILLEITSPIPSHYRPYYQRWDTEVDNMPQSSFAIHHPSGDYKKISHDRHRSSLTTCTFCGRVPNTHFLVSGWDDGTTERGSSGCGLLDATTRRLVAVLSGGSASCPDNNGYDFFGRLSRAYDSGLGRWLMPVNTGVRKMDARDGSSTYAVNSVASSTPAMTADRLLALSPDGSGAGVVTTEGGSAGLVQVKLNAWPEGARTVEVIVATSDTTEGQVSCMGMAGGLVLSDTSVRLSDESTLAAQLGGTTFSERCTLRFTSSTSSRQFAGGVTNGAAWYPVSGTSQDALYASTGALEMTIEVSDTKAPSAHQLDRMAADHERALSGFVMRAAGASGALAGRVVDAATNAGIPGAVVTVNNGVPILVGDDGTYHNALLPGDYSVRVSAPGYAPGTRTVRVIGPVSQYAIALPIATADFALGKVSSVEVESSGEMGVEVQGTCRSLTVRVTNATPNGRVVIARGPGGRAGGFLGIKEIQIRTS